MVWKKTMPLALNQYLNRTILVSIPALLGNLEARQCQLVGVEASGVWLVSGEIGARVLPKRVPDQSTAAPMIFVPFAQIGAIVPIVPAPNATLGLKPATVAAPPAAVAGEPDNQSKPKRSR
jgi:hypothetical protein